MLLHAAAGAVVVLCVALAWASRGNLNVDGVSYLDLARRLVTGDFSGFVQGYWSPAYPALLSLLVVGPGLSGGTAVAAAHGLNLVIALAAVLVIWREAFRRGATIWGMLALSAFLLASARTVRIDAVTPDLLLLLMLLSFGLELLRPEGWRFGRVGVLGGLAFLVKTSIWPWMVVASVVGLIALGKSPARRRDLLKAIAVAAVPFALWTLAVSIDEGHPTLGSTGRLGACWYLYSCDGRTPDSHRGEHVNYQDWQLDTGPRARIATFGDAPWTYAPWSDPSTWQAGILTQVRIRPSPWQFTKYAAKQVGLIVGIWMAGLLCLVLVPVLLATRDAPRLMDMLRTPSATLMGLGILGMLQFAAVHAEPRLVAPFVMLFALGWFAWRLQGTARVGLLPIACAGFLVALAIGAWHLVDQSMVTASAAGRARQLEVSHPPHGGPYRVAVLGPALPMVPDLYRAGVRVVAQVIAPDPATLLAWPGVDQSELAARLRELGASELWISRGPQGFRIAPLSQGPPAPPR